MNNKSIFKQKSIQQKVKKKPPPRPPPPNFDKIKSKSSWNLNSQLDNVQLIEFSPPNSPKRCSNNEVHQNFGGSVSSSFSSSTSSLASSKKSFEYETGPFNFNHLNQSTFYVGSQTVNDHDNRPTIVIPQISVPTIIRAQPPKKKNVPTISREKFTIDDPPMPSIPPPSPPKENTDIATPYGIALYDFPVTQTGDLRLQVGDVVILLKKISEEWLYGRVDDQEGIFPICFIDIKVPLPENENIVKALYEFRPQMPGDLELQPGQSVHVIKKVSDFWLYGECNGRQGQFPINFIDRIPNDI